MTGTRNPFARKQAPGYPAAIANLKREVYRLLDLPPEVVVSISELACHEPGCPEIETVVMVMIEERPPLTARIHKPIPDVNSEDLAQVFSLPGLSTAGASG